MYASFSPAKHKLAAAVVATVMGSGIVYSFVGSSTHADSRASGPTPREAREHANSLSEAFRFASEKVMPAVVTIQHTMEPKVAMEGRRKSDGADARPELPKEFRNLDPFLKKFFEEGQGMEGMREMPQRRSESAGSGVIIDKSGIVLTNNHVVAGGGKVVVKLSDGREFTAKEVKTDPRTDLAIVKIEASSDLPVASLGNSDNVQVGDWVLALGQPFGLSNTVTQGIISAKGRGIGITDHEEFLQTDAAINPGNSGGPLVNLQGEIIGINTAISSTSGGYQGIGFAVPVNVAKWVSDQLRSEGLVHRAYLGIGIQPLTQELASNLGMDRPRGALVTEVRTGSPAEKAGVKVGDVVLSYAGQSVTNPRQLSAIVARTALGSQAAIEVLRDGKETKLNVAVQEMPKNFTVSQNRNTQDDTIETPKTKEFSDLGLEVAPLTAEEAQQLGFKTTDGVTISSVENDSPAGRAGLQAGTLIERVGNKPVKTVEEFQAAAKSASLEKGVLMLVRTSEGTRFVVLKKE